MNFTVLTDCYLFKFEAIFFYEAEFIHNEGICNTKLIYRLYVVFHFCLTDREDEDWIQKSMDAQLHEHHQVQRIGQSTQKVNGRTSIIVGQFDFSFKTELKKSYCIIKR